MKYTIEHELPGRLRLRCPEGSFDLPESCIIGALLETQNGVTGARASHRTGSLLIHYEGDVRDSILTAVSLLDKSFYDGIDGSVLVPEEQATFSGAVSSMFGGVLLRSLLPRLLRHTITFFRALPLLSRGAGNLFRYGRLNVSVLDASAVGVSLLRRDFRTATVITTLLALGELLENWTHKKSKESLTDSLALHIDKLWVRKDGGEVRIPIGELQIGDLVIVRTGSVIPVDGVVVEGDGMVNQAAMTGESEAVHRAPGLSVYAGTVVEEGELVIRTTAFDNETRIHRIAELIEESEELKADIQNRAEKMADAIVPWSFMLAGGIYLATRNAMRATAALLVDYSCAIKLSTPLAILSAMREGAGRGMLIKGGKFLEALSEADTVVFDKTGTLTVSTPAVVKIIPFEGYERRDILRIAACLEEHFPHSIARAVVKQAEKEGVAHREMHSTVEYLAAHGIVSRIAQERVLIGSAHFVFEDEGVETSPEQQAIIDVESEHSSLLYLAIKGRLAGLLCIEDPLRKDARDIVRKLRDSGVEHVVMLTGDNQRIAANVAAEIGIDDVRSQLLPAEKTDIVKFLKNRGGKVVMVGDGINDSPALAAADVGVAMRSGADIAKEVADVVLIDNRLDGIVDARRLGDGVMRKIYRNYTFIIGTNSLLLALGITGTITPALSALLHNLSTVGASVYSLMPVLPAKEEDSK